MQHQKPEWHAEKLVHFVQCQGHSEGLYNQNMTISTISSKLLVCFATKLGLIVQHHNKLECPVKKWDYCVKVTAKVQNVSECLSGWYFLIRRTLCYQFWYGDPASWARVMLFFFFFLLSSRSRSQWGFIWSKYDSFYYIFWTVDSLATKVGMVMQHHEPDSCGHFKFFLLFFNVKVTARAHMIKIWLFLLCLLNCWFFGNLTWSDYISS